MFSAISKYNQKQENALSQILPIGNLERVIAYCDLFGEKLYRRLQEV